MRSDVSAHGAQGCLRRVSGFFPEERRREE